MGSTEWHVQTEENRTRLATVCYGAGAGDGGEDVVWSLSSMWRKVVGAGAWGQALTWRGSSKWKGADGTGCHRALNKAVLHFLGEGGMTEGCK